MQWGHSNTPPPPPPEIAKYYTIIYYTYSNFHLCTYTCVSMVSEATRSSSMPTITHTCSIYMYMYVEFSPQQKKVVLFPLSIIKELASRLAVTMENIPKVNYY
jgi:hypothetical protein